MGHHEAEYKEIPVLGQMEMGYVKVWFTLCVLFLISVAGPEVGELTGIKAITLITAFGIAFWKAWLVVKEFMHVPVEQPVIHYILITCLAFMGLFFAGVSPDVMNHNGSNWENVAAKRVVAEGLAEGEAGGHGHGGDHGDAGHGDEAGHGEAAGEGHGDEAGHGEAAGEGHGEAEGGH